MAFDLRCPNCNAKLRFDDPPAAGSPVECPKCDTSFSAPEPDDDPPPPPRKKKKKKKPAPAAAPSSYGPKKGKAKKDDLHPAALLGMIGGGFLAYLLLCFVILWVLNRPGRADELLGYVPAECNWVRGVNLDHMAKYPGYKEELYRYITPADMAASGGLGDSASQGLLVRQAANELARAAGADPETFLEYMVLAQVRTSGGGAYLFGTTKGYSADKVSKELKKATPVTIGGEQWYRLPADAPGVLADSLLWMPASKVAIVVPASAVSSAAGESDPAGKAVGGNKIARTAQDAMAQKIVQARAARADSFAGGLDNTGKMATRGAFWLIVRATGDYENYIAAATAWGKKDFPEVANKGQKATTLGWWATPGGRGVRYGMGMECETSRDAAEVAKKTSEGTFSKADDSNVPQKLKERAGATSTKEFKEFLMYLAFDHSGKTAFITSRTTTPENSRGLLEAFADPTLAAGMPPEAPKD